MRELMHLPHRHHSRGSDTILIGEDWSSLDKPAKGLFTSGRSLRAVIHAGAARRWCRPEAAGGVFPKPTFYGLAAPNAVLFRMRMNSIRGSSQQTNQCQGNCGRFIRAAA